MAFYIFMENIFFFKKKKYRNTDRGKKIPLTLENMPSQGHAQITGISCETKSTGIVLWINRIFFCKALLPHLLLLVHQLHKILCKVSEGKDMHRGYSQFKIKILCDPGQVHCRHHMLDKEAQTSPDTRVHPLSEGTENNLILKLISHFKN